MCIDAEYIGAHVHMALRSDASQTLGDRSSRAWARAVASDPALGPNFA
jgi:hypothetical protein